MMKTLQHNKPSLNKIALKALMVFFLVALAACLPAGGSSAGIQVLPALKDAGLSGSLIFIHPRENGSQVIRLDLATGARTVLFSAPDRSWLGSLTVTPDGKTALLAYAPPPPKGQTQFGFTDFYTLVLDGSAQPQLFQAHTMINEAYFNPTFSADGKSLYYSHNMPSQSARSGVESLVERAAWSGKALENPQVIMHNAIGPALSPDGTKLAYLTVSDVVSNNEMYISGADGSNPTPLVTAKQASTVDAHLFSPDGKFVYYSSPSESADGSPADVRPGDSPTRGWIERTFGAQPVSAHETPSDWFRVAVSGGDAQRMTKIGMIGLAGAFSPDGQWMAFTGDKGVYVMKPDGTQVTQLASGEAMGGVSWVK